MQSMSPAPESKRTRGRPRGSRPALSLPAVVDASVALLDEAGQDALTFRALAARMETGVGAIYHYVTGRDELLDRATNAILADVLSGVDVREDPFEVLRTLSATLFDTLQAHEWAGAYLLRDTTMQPNSLRIFEAMGQQFMRMQLTSAQCFNAASGLLSFVVGSGAEIREMPAAFLEEGVSQEEHLQEFADAWLALDAHEFPFLHTIARDFAQHDDREQFLAGVDIYLAGVRAQLG